jgi:hypothetical protein
MALALLIGIGGSLWLGFVIGVFFGRRDDP